MTETYSHSLITLASSNKTPGDVVKDPKKWTVSVSFVLNNLDKCSAI